MVEDRAMRRPPPERKRERERKLNHCRHYNSAPHHSFVSADNVKYPTNICGKGCVKPPRSQRLPGRGNTQPFLHILYILVDYSGTIEFHIV